MALTPGTRLGPYEILADYGIKKGLAVQAKTEYRVDDREARISTGIPGMIRAFRIYFGQWET